MLAIVIAIVLSGIAPDPIVTPTPVLHDLLSSSAPFSGDGAPAGGTPGIGLGPACDYGTPQIDAGLWQNVNSFARTFTMPACTQTSFYAGSAPVFGPVGFASPWLVVQAVRPLRPSTNVTAPVRAFTGPGFGLRTAEPDFERPRVSPGIAPGRRH